MSRALMVLLVMSVVWVRGGAQDIAADDDAALTTGTDTSMCVPWPEITAIAFTAGSRTESRRRTPNLPTLNCVGNCPTEARLDAAQCLQIGLSDRGTPSWKCIPQFAPSNRRYAFGTVRVECEGCTKRGDLSVVRGSCVLMYSVVEPGRSGSRRRHYESTRATETADVLTSLLFVLFLVFACVVGRKFCCPEPSVTGKPVDGYPMAMGGAGGAAAYPGSSQYHQHHYYGGGGGFGGGGFGTGMLTGLVVGDMLSRPHYSGGGGGYYDSGYGGGGGDDSWGGGGWGSSDGAGFGGGDAV